MDSDIATIVKISELEQSMQWVQHISQQVQKDLDYCAIDPGLLNSSNVFLLRDQLTGLLKGLPSSSKQNFLYRVDIPEVVSSMSETDERLAELVILRSFQKVWLRKTYS